MITSDTTRVLHRALLCALLLLVTACSEGSPASSGETLHAGAGVVPGSYEDWCAEHELAESKCTRCDPSLVPAFKATDDWCAEHGLPESQCVTCDPSRQAVRPPKPEAR